MSGVFIKRTQESHIHYHTQSNTFNLHQPGSNLFIKYNFGKNLNKKFFIINQNIKVLKVSIQDFGISPR